MRFQGATHSVRKMAGAAEARWDGGPHRPLREGFDVPRAAQLMIISAIEQLSLLAGSGGVRRRMGAV